MNAVLELLDAGHAGEAMATLVLAATLVLLRQVVLRWVRASELPLEVRRRWQVTLRNLALAVFVAGVGAIWAEQIRTVAVSLLAFAVAFVIATKELIMCFAGAALRTSAVRLGDRIEIKGLRGDVVDTGALTTTLIEIGPGPAIHQATGRLLVLPNSIFLTDSTANESLAPSFVFHTVALPIRPSADLRAAEERLLAAAREATAEFEPQARAALDRLAEQRNIDPPAIEPRVWVRIVDPERIELTLRFVAPGRLRGRIEQRIVRQFLEDSRILGAPEPTTSDT